MSVASPDQATHRSGNLRAVFGTRLRLLFAIGSASAATAKSMILSPIF
jgi:hypothetical protein